MAISKHTSMRSLKDSNSIPVAVDSVLAAEVVEQIDRQFLQPEGINLYLENSNSALWPNIPLAPDWLWSS